MRMPVVFLFGLLLIACTHRLKTEDLIGLNFNYNYSSDVIHGVLINRGVAESNNSSCKVKYSTFRVLESFKGSMKVGATFRAIGIELHEYKDVGSEQFLLLKPFVATEFPGFGDCKNEAYAEYLSIHNWCCSINNDGEKSFVMYDQMGEDIAGSPYLAPVKNTFKLLRAKKSEKL
jgi:hypothetical protein